jgi:predicted AlkP superfamily phosphohydrolase/phosphomutase
MLAFLQFDAVSQPTIERMLLEGRLPALQALKDRGRWLPLEAQTDFFEAAVYATLYSGTEVGDHGLYYGFVWSAADQRVHYLDFDGVPETIWERLGRAGRRSLVIDPYVPWRAIGRGISLSGWQLTHKIIPRWSSPPSAYREFARRFGRTPLLQDISGYREKSNLLAMRKILLAGPDRAAALVVDALGREAFDFIWVSFISAHLTGHLFWDPSEKAAPDLDDADRRLMKSTVEEAYMNTDRAIGRIVAALPADTDLVVFSPLGMGPETSRSDLLPDMLKAILSEQGRTTANVAKPGIAGHSMWQFRARVPSAWRAAIARFVPGAIVRKIVARLYLRGVDWSRTQAVVLPGDHYGYIRLNVRGRERHGIVEPGDADALLERIATGLMTFTDADGEPAIASIERTKDRVPGARAGDLPDLIVRWSERPSSRIAGVGSPRFGAIAREGVGTGRSGNHVPGTWALVVPGTSPLGAGGRHPQLVDFARTACDRLGVAADGLPGESLFEQSDRHFAARGDV